MSKLKEKSPEKSRRTKMWTTYNELMYHLPHLKANLA